jgi:hypothetical protein
LPSSSTRIPKPEEAIGKFTFNIGCNNFAESINKYICNTTTVCTLFADIVVPPSGVPHEKSVDKEGSRFRLRTFLKEQECKATSLGGGSPAPTGAQGAHRVRNSTDRRGPSKVCRSQCCACRFEPTLKLADVTATDRVEQRGGPSYYLVVACVCFLYTRRFVWSSKTLECGFVRKSVYRIYLVYDILALSYLCIFISLSISSSGFQKNAEVTFCYSRVSPITCAIGECTKMRSMMFPLVISILCGFLSVVLSSGEHVKFHSTDDFEKQVLSDKYAWLIAGLESDRECPRCLLVRTIS